MGLRQTGIAIHSDIYRELEHLTSMRIYLQRTEIGKEMLDKCRYEWQQTEDTAMTKIIIERNPTSNKYCEKAEVRTTGKAGRLARMFAKNRKKQTANTLSRVDIACLERPSKKMIDIANYACNKGKIKPTTVRAKEKIRRSCRELIRI
ncbi:hypothetical protein [Glaesserella parasuis]|uniref:hypothetical protein n=1 Tax=Glaesserella parasuis TaxID=738 RepID=UPI001040303D|nr:hypothetical protein [Glaesserella parasuis]MCT8555856.1 hypothetical protein [Glaesserella parasuis]MCT8783935.1 hypothetical protein [Glaesserella parasuis]MDG6334059.1 hypothetical protein [Glaesserella parasuis]